VTGQFETNGNVKLSWKPVQGAKAYVIHYGGANESDPHSAIFMGYTESATWTLAVGDVPVLAKDDKIYFYVQAYKDLGIGENDIEKARYLHDGDFLGSAWSDPVILTKTTL